MPLLFTFTDYSLIEKSLRDVPGLTPGQFSITRYENQDLHASIETSVSGEHCFILGGVGAPDCQTLSLLLLAHTLKKEGARRVTGILPYLAYSREDKIKPGESLTTAWAGALLKACAFDDIWTVDIHGEEDRRLMPLPIESLSPAKIFGERLATLALTDACFVSPDQGAVSRCQAVQSAAGIARGEVVYFEKHRSAAGIAHRSPIGKVDRCAVVVDDILDTGATLVSACEKLVAVGAEELYICVTHGLFCGQRWRDLWSLPVKHIFCTDTVPACAMIEDPRITALTIAPVLRERLGQTQASLGASS